MTAKDDQPCVGDWRDFIENLNVIDDHLCDGKWRDFIENLTVDWLMEHYTGKGHTSDPDNRIFPDRISTYHMAFVVEYDGLWFRFDAPIGIRALLPSAEGKLFQFLPKGIWDDFIRTLNL